VNVEKVVNVCTRGNQRDDHGGRARTTRISVDSPTRTNVHDVHNVHRSTSDLDELALVLATAYLRMLLSRGNDTSPQNQLDVVDDNEAPLPERVSRRTKLA